MKIDDLKANARLVLKGPLALQNFKAGEVAIVDAAGTENVIFKGGFSVKRDVALERFCTEPEWKEYQEGLQRKPEAILIKSLHDKLDEIIMRQTAFSLRLDTLAKAVMQNLSHPVAHELKVERAPDKKKNIRILKPGTPSIQGLLIFVNAGRPLTKDSWAAQFQKEFGKLKSESAITFGTLKRMGLIVEVYMEGSTEIHYKLSSFAHEIKCSGIYSIGPRNEVKLLREGDTSGQYYKPKKAS